jgi:Skp family chaperone for outer membrane proteins
MVSLTEIRNRLQRSFTADQADLIANLHVEMHDQLVTRHDFAELRSVVERLAKSQQQLAESQQRTEHRVEELAESQRELAESQRELVESQRELADAQRRTEHAQAIAWLSALVSAARLDQSQRYGGGKQTVSRLIAHLTVQR